MTLRILGTYQNAIVFSYKGGGSAHLGAFVNTGNDHAGKNAA